MAATLRALASLISASADTIDARCAAAGTSFPDLEGAPGASAVSSEAVYDDPAISRSADIIIAAAGQLIAAVRRPQDSLFNLAYSTVIPAALRTANLACVPEIIREEGGKCHVDVLAKKNNTDPLKLAGVLRLLVTHHVFREVEPNVFANNRISCVLDSGKDVSILKDSPLEKYVEAEGYCAIVDAMADEIGKALLHFPQTLIDPSRPGSDIHEMDTAFNRAFNFDRQIFDWYGLPENSFYLARVTEVLNDTRRLSPPGAIARAYPWGDVPEGATVVDVGGGLGLLAMDVMREYPKLNMIIQDRPGMLEEAKKYWHRQMPDTPVTFQAHDFFEPQPANKPVVYILSLILHDWSDEWSAKILRHMRNGALAETRIIIVEHVLQHACRTDNAADITPGANEDVFPEPLLPNGGLARANPYLLDVQMMGAMNGQEKTLEHMKRVLHMGGWKIEHISRVPNAFRPYIIAAPL